MSASGRAAGEAALNAVVGDYLARSGSALATKMELCDHGRRLSALPEGSSRLCILVHGMACTEGCWAFVDQPDIDYGRLLERDIGLTPLYVRFNSGLPIVENGRQFAELLASVIERSPVAIDEITLIGHSLGGLVIRSALHQGRGQAWASRVRRAFYVGTPHLGSPLEKLGHAITSVLHAIDDPITKLIGDVADVRSAAVKDLRHGDVDGTGEAIPLAEGVEHFFVAGTLPGPVLSQVLGDGLVRVASATGAKGAGGDVEVNAAPGGEGNTSSTAQSTGMFHGLHHMTLAHDPDVYTWIAARCGTAGVRRPVEPRVDPRPDEVSIPAYAELVHDAIDEGARAIQGAHEALTARPYDLLEAVAPFAIPSRIVRGLHFGVLRGSYAAVRVVNAALRGVTLAWRRAEDGAELGRE